MANLELTMHADAARRWYAAATLPNKEQMAVEHLERQGFQTFCPLEQVERRHARKVWLTTAPVFRGYLFVGMDPALARWRSINGTWGVRALITNTNGPVPLRVGVVETLLASTDASGVVGYVDALRPGTLVRLRAGPLADELGIIERLDGRGRVQLLMSFLGGHRRAVVDRSQLLKVA
jgi:transcription antitermination factor NusG